MQFGFHRTQDGTYTVTREDKEYLRGIVSAEEAARIVDMLCQDARELESIEVKNENS